MNISLVVAMSENNAIGRNGALPWHLPNDLKHFKQVTWGKPIIMGRTTYESIGKPLPGRTNIILTRDANFEAPGCTVLHSKEAVLEVCQAEDEIMIMGGAQIYQLFLPLVTKLYLTLVHTKIEADTFFPPLDFDAWQEVERVRCAQDEKHEVAYSFITFVREG